MPIHHRTLILALFVLALLSACAPQAASPTPSPAPTPTAESAVNLPPGERDLSPPELGSFDPAAVEMIALADYPIMPVVTDHAREILDRGLESRHNPRVFSKIGDCMTAAAAFLTPFGSDDYMLGDYAAELQPVMDHFGGIPARSEGFELDSFANPGLSTASGFNAASVLDATWSDPNWCQANESPLACEYRVSRPGLAIIMFGTNDVYHLDAERFDYYLRQVVLETIKADVVPVLNTFPTRPEFPEKSVLFNQIIVAIAQDYDLPLINLWLALQDIPNQGVDTTETIHLTVPADGKTGYLDEDHLTAGYTYRNLITLQALAVLRDGLGLMAG
jgi:hypothetical protein